MREANPWWTDPHARPLDWRPWRRHDFRRVYDRCTGALPEGRPAVILYGLRQAGKTQLARQVLAEILSEGHLPGTQVAHLDVDDIRARGVVTLLDLLEAWAPFRDRSQPAFLVVDEIQKLSRDRGGRDWARQLKGLTDRGEIAVLCTGSAAGVLQTAGAEGAGRTELIKLEPLSFREFRQLRSPSGQPSRAARFVDLDRYLEVGGFPQHARVEETSRVRDSIVQTGGYVDSVLRADLEQFRNHTAMEQLFAGLMEQSGEEQNLEKLATRFGQAQNTLRNWLEAMASVFLIDRVPILETTRFRELAKRPKIYAGDPAFVTAFASGSAPLSDPRVKGRLLEVAVLRHLREVAGRSGGRVLCVQLRSGRRKVGEADFAVVTDDLTCVIEVTANEGDNDEKARSTLAVAQNLASKTASSRKLRAAVVHGGAQRFDAPVARVPAADFLTEIIHADADDPCRGLRALSSEVEP